MRWGFRILTIALAALLLGAFVQARPVKAASRQVWAYYFGWYTGDSWGDGRLVDRPAAPYDSRDSGAIGRQIDEARGAGIDAFIMSWFGPKNGNLTSQVFNTLLDQAAARGFAAGASLDMQEGGYNATPQEVIASLTYLINDRANHPGYLRFDGKPVIYFWNQARFSTADWASIRAQVDPNRNTIWVAEGTNTGFLPTFDGLYLFNTAWAGDPGAVASGWFANTRAAGGWFYTPTVMPGWDESRIAGRENPTAPQDRNSGGFLTTSWNGAANSGAGVILIVSWNEYLENSHIEPSQAFGTLALDTLRPLIAAWKGGYSAPAAPAPTGDAAAPAAPGVQVITPTIILNVRTGAGTSFPKIGEILPGQKYAIQGESNGWYQIDYGGQQGFVSGEFVVVMQGQPTTSSAAAPAAGTPSGITYTLRNNLRLRAAPSTGSATLTTIPYQTVLEVVGRTADGGWLQVNYNSTSGWVSSEYGSLSGDSSAIPVTG